MAAADPFAGLDFQQIIGFLENLDGVALMPPADTEGLVARFPELAAVEVRDVAIDGAHRDAPARSYRVPGAGGTGLVWVHGGGFIGGDLDFAEAHWVSLAIAAAGFPVLSLDYRKALRGVHHPEPSDDVLTGWLWATIHAEELGIAPDDLHLAGASAGANLVAGVTKRLRDGAGQMPSTLVLVYPIVHAELPPFSAELQEKLQDEVVGFSPAAVRDMTLQYAGSESLFSDPYAFAPNGDLSGQPPVFILNSESDTLRASGEAYGDALRLAGVDVTVVTEPGAHHGHLNGPDEPGALASLDRLVAWLRSRGTHPR